MKYNEWYLCQISRTDHAIICLYCYLQRFCNFHMWVFQIKLTNTTCLSQSNCRNFSFSSIMELIWARFFNEALIYDLQDEGYYMFTAILVILRVNKGDSWMQVCVIHLTYPPCSLVKCSNIYTGAPVFFYEYFLSWNVPLLTGNFIH